MNPKSFPKLAVSQRYQAGACQQKMQQGLTHHRAQRFKHGDAALSVALRRIRKTSG
jgi:hypothetical protein